MNKNSTLTPFRFRNVSDKLLLTNEIGKFSFYSDDLMSRFYDDELSSGEIDSLKQQSIIVEDSEQWKLLSLLRNTRNATKSDSEKLSYLMVIPTLRCDLSCSYCQVSRAPINAKGFDWSEDNLEMFDGFIKSNGSNGMKIEFQGGEPTLRIDLLERIIEISESYFTDLEFVICTNLVTISDDLRKLLEKSNLVISTSIDGPESTMTANRTEDTSVSKAVIENVKWVIDNYGHSKLSALPTIATDQIDHPEKVIDYYRSLGFRSIFLRPVNYQGFARKSYKELSQQIESWQKFWLQAMNHILKISKDDYFEEFYLGTLVRSIFADRASGFVDYASPANYASHYCVIDHDGTIFPTDESRMLSRTRQIDLSIGNLEKGLDREIISRLNFNAIHHTNEDCLHCAYLPYCGIDIIDDLSRYERFDISKTTSWHCQKHIFLFDFIFEKVANWDVEWLKLFNSWIHRSQNTSDALQIFK